MQSPVSQPTDRPAKCALTDTLDLLTNQAHREFDNATEALFYIGDGLQRAAIDGCFNLFRGQTWTPSHLLRLSAEAVRQTVHFSRLLFPNQTRLAWQELRNKLEVFILVRNLPSILGLPSDRLVPLPELVAKAYAVSPFAALWAVEGLGHYYADMYWTHRGVPSGLLLEEQASVPTKSLLMLHAGLGLSFADRVLGTLTSQASPEQVRDALQYFLLLCRTNSRPGYLGAAVESLGLVTRDFYAEQLPCVDEQLRETAPEFLGYFWHGVGRALYFSLQYFLPFLRPVWSGAVHEARTEPDRLSAVAGLSWAVTLVNMGNPATMENVVQSYADKSSITNAFTNGIMSAIIVREECTPNLPLISSFCNHQPCSNDADLLNEWELRIADPCRTALSHYYPRLKQANVLDQVFRYQDLAKVVSELESPNRSVAVNHRAYAN